MKKEKLIYVGILGLVFLGVFLVYQFYFAAKLEEYARNRELLASLNTTNGNLRTTFGDAAPEDVIVDHKGKVEAWNEAIEVRVPYFTDGDWRIHETPPDDVFILQFWYGDESRELVKGLWEKAQKTYGATVYQNMPEGFPTNLQSTLNVTYAEDWQGLDISAKLVNEELERLSYGISAYELLMNNDAQQILHVDMLDIGSSGFVGKGVDYVRLGLSFTMEMKPLVTFLEKLRSEDSYYSLAGLKIRHPYVAARYEPRLRVDMYLLRAHTTETKTPGGTDVAPNAESVYNTQLIGQVAQSNLSIDDEEGNPRRVPLNEPGTIAKGWRWFKHTVLFMK